MLIFQIYGNLVSVFPVQKQAENKADNFGDFFVNQPKILVAGVFDISVWGFGYDLLSACAFCADTRFYFFFTFLLMSLAYHSGMILMNGANSNVSGFSLSIPLFTAIKRTLFLRKISIAFPTWR